MTLKQKCTEQQSKKEDIHNALHLCEVVLHLPWHYCNVDYERIDLTAYPKWFRGYYSLHIKAKPTTKHHI